MVAELLSTAKWQFHIRKNNRLHFSFTTKIPNDILLTKMSAELPSTEQIFTETSRLVPLNFPRTNGDLTKTDPHCFVALSKSNVFLLHDLLQIRKDEFHYQESIIIHGVSANERA